MLTWTCPRIFDVYPRMDASVQEAVGVLLTPLIRSLGPTHTKLLTILRSFPPASETLALRVLSILTESGKPGPNIVALVKTLMLERDLDARFLIPIAGEMDKVRWSGSYMAISPLLIGQSLVRRRFIDTCQRWSASSATSLQSERWSDRSSDMSCRLFLTFHSPPTWHGRRRLT